MSTSRIQPVLTKGESELVDQMADLTHTKRTEVIKNALAVYHWFLRQAITGACIVAREPGGDETHLETPELAALDSKSLCLGPEELGLLARELDAARDPKEAACLRQRITRGFYGI
jgi:hypothetical protein